MRNIVSYLAVLGLLAACESGEQVQASANAAYQNEMQLWNIVGQRTARECPIKVTPKTQIERQNCIEGLIRRDVSPHVSYPALVDYMLAKMRVEAEKYVAGEISKKALIENSNAVSRDYWAHWERAWGNRVQAGSDSNPLQGLGDVFLVSTQSAAESMRQRQEDARTNMILNRPVTCINHGYTSTCR